MVARYARTTPAGPLPRARPMTVAPCATRIAAPARGTPYRRMSQGAAAADASRAAALVGPSRATAPQDHRSPTRDALRLAEGWPTSGWSTSAGPPGSTPCSGQPQAIHAKALTGRERSDVVRRPRNARSSTTGGARDRDRDAATHFGARASMGARYHAVSNLGVGDNTQPAAVSNLVRTSSDLTATAGLVATLQ